MVYMHKWSPVSYRSSAGQGRYTAVPRNQAGLYNSLVLANDSMYLGPPPSNLSLLLRKSHSWLWMGKWRDSNRSVASILYLYYITWFYKSSAVADMGDLLATIDIGRKVVVEGAAMSLFVGGAVSPSNTMCRVPSDIY